MRPSFCWTVGMEGCFFTSITTNADTVSLCLPGNGCTTMHGRLLEEPVSGSVPKEHASPCTWPCCSFPVMCIEFLNQMSIFYHIQVDRPKSIHRHSKHNTQWYQTISATVGMWQKPPWRTVAIEQNRSTFPHLWFVTLDCHSSIMAEIQLQCNLSHTVFHQRSRNKNQPGERC